MKSRISKIELSNEVGGDPMRNWTSLLVALGILLLGNNAWADESKYPTLEAEYHYRKVYLSKPAHKAFAVGISGTFGSSWGYGSDKEAIKNAIATCRTGLGGSDSTCRVVVVGNRLIVKDAFTMPSWQIAATGVDKPLSSGVRFLVPEGKAKGIVLYLHGCDGMDSQIHDGAWGAFYNFLGLDFYAPNSFADERPPSVCGGRIENGLHRASEVYRLRIAQTLRTIAELRKENPGKPIYLWGHSEGSLIAQAIEAKVKGIIVSGGQCGVYGMPVATPSGVPILYVLGAMDTFVGGMKYPFTEKSLSVCKKQMGNRKWSAAVVQNSGHAIWPWRETAAKAIAKFVGEKWRKTEPLSGEISLTDKTKLELKEFKYRKSHAAFAADSKGNYAWSLGWEYQEDADQFALYECARLKGIDIFATARHECVLVGADGKARK
jgi:hypothetical protein